ncbi:YrhK family protein [Saccharicrinis sp. FJH54]|uniref:YrhK family protein n=1 Tax=Saccharicrinis sp. FJH54 TaxID=3344665 RepID=UPI0035D49D0C
MPHLFTNRPRQHNIFSNAPAGSVHFSWESFNSVLYLLGGLTFVTGSIFFLPQYDQNPDTGAWIFFGGSLVYLLVTVHDLFEASAYLRSRQHASFWERIELFAAIVYVSGTILFIVGSLFFLKETDMVAAGSWCFILGSFLFLLGAFINVIQIIQAGTMFTLQLMNATAICFTVGAVIFLLASVPYLWTFKQSALSEKLYGYMAWEYITGSIFFLAGGMFNYYRSYLANKHYKKIEAKQPFHNKGSR